MTPNSQWIAPSVAIVLAVTNGVLLYKTTRLQQTFQEHLARDNFFVNRKIPRFHVATLSGELIDPFANRLPRFLLLVFFSPDDCEVCLDEIRSLRSILRRFPREDFGMLAVASGGDKERIQSLGEQFQPLPIYIDPEGDLWKKLGIRTTPLKVLIDHETNVIFIDYPNKDSFRQEQFQKLLVSLIEMRL